MAKSSLAHQAHHHDPEQQPHGDLEHVSGIAARVLRGLELYREHKDEIRFLENDVWRCPSANGSKASHYLVNLALGTCECADFEYRHLPCKHLEAVRLAAKEGTLRIDYPVEEELLAACEYVLDWFEQWEEHANHEADFGGEHTCMRRLRRVVQLARQGEAS